MFSLRLSPPGCPQKTPFARVICEWMIHSCGSLTATTTTGSHSVRRRRGVVSALCIPMLLTVTAIIFAIPKTSFIFAAAQQSSEVVWTFSYAHPSLPSALLRGKPQGDATSYQAFIDASDQLVVPASENPQPTPAPFASFTMTDVPSDADRLDVSVAFSFLAGADYHRSEISFEQGYPFLNGLSMQQAELQPPQDVATLWPTLPPFRKFAALRLLKLATRDYTKPNSYCFDREMAYVFDGFEQNENSNPCSIDLGGQSFASGDLITMNISFYQNGTVTLRPTAVGGGASSMLTYQRLTLLGMPTQVRLSVTGDVTPGSGHSAVNNQIRLQSLSYSYFLKPLRTETSVPFATGAIPTKTTYFRSASTEGSDTSSPTTDVSGSLIIRNGALTASGGALTETFAVIELDIPSDATTLSVSFIYAFSSGYFGAKNITGIVAFEVGSVVPYIDPAAFVPDPTPPPLTSVPPPMLHHSALMVSNLPSRDGHGTGYCYERPASVEFNVFHFGNESVPPCTLDISATWSPQSFQPFNVTFDLDGGVQVLTGDRPSMFYQRPAWDTVWQLPTSLIFAAEGPLMEGRMRELKYVTTRAPRRTATATMTEGATTLAPGMTSLQWNYGWTTIPVPFVRAVRPERMTYVRDHSVARMPSVNDNNELVIDQQTSAAAVSYAVYDFTGLIPAAEAEWFSISVSMFMDVVDGGNALAGLYFDRGGVPFDSASQTADPAATISNSPYFVPLTTLRVYHRPVRNENVSWCVDRPDAMQFDTFDDGSSGGGGGAAVPTMYGYRCGTDLGSTFPYRQWRTLNATFYRASSRVTLRPGDERVVEAQRGPMDPTGFPTSLRLLLQGDRSGHSVSFRDLAYSYYVPLPITPTATHTHTPTPTVTSSSTVTSSTGTPTGTTSGTTATAGPTLSSATPTTSTTFASTTFSSSASATVPPTSTTPPYTPAPPPSMAWSDLPMGVTYVETAVPFAQGTVPPRATFLRLAVEGASLNNHSHVDGSSQSVVVNSQAFQISEEGGRNVTRNGTSTAAYFQLALPAAGAAIAVSVAFSLWTQNHLFGASDMEAALVFDVTDWVPFLLTNGFASDPAAAATTQPPVPPPNNSGMFHYSALRIRDQFSRPPPAAANSFSTGTGMTGTTNPSGTTSFLGTTYASATGTTYASATGTTMYSGGATTTETATPMATGPATPYNDTNVTSSSPPEYCYDRNQSVELGVFHKAGADAAPACALDLASTWTHQEWVDVNVTFSVTGLMRVIVGNQSNATATTGAFFQRPFGGDDIQPWWLPGYLGLFVDGKDAEARIRNLRYFTLASYPTTTVTETTTMTNTETTSTKTNSVTKTTTAPPLTNATVNATTTTTALPVAARCPSCGMAASAVPTAANRDPFVQTACTTSAADFDTGYIYITARDVAPIARGRVVLGYPIPPNTYISSNSSTAASVQQSLAPLMQTFVASAMWAASAEKRCSAEVASDVALSAAMDAPSSLAMTATGASPLVTSATTDDGCARAYRAKFNIFANVTTVNAGATNQTGSRYCVETAPNPLGGRRTTCSLVLSAAGPVWKPDGTAWQDNFTILSQKVCNVSWFSQGVGSGTEAEPMFICGVVRSSAVDASSSPSFLQCRSRPVSNYLAATLRLSLPSNLVDASSLASCLVVLPAAGTNGTSRSLLCPVALKSGVVVPPGTVITAVLNVTWASSSTTARSANSVVVVEVDFPASSAATGTSVSDNNQLLESLARITLPSHSVRPLTSNTQPFEIQLALVDTVSSTVTVASAQLVNALGQSRDVLGDSRFAFLFSTPEEVQSKKSLSISFLPFALRASEAAWYGATSSSSTTTTVQLKLQLFFFSTNVTTTTAGASRRDFVWQQAAAAPSVADAVPDAGGINARVVPGTFAVQAANGAQGNTTAFPTNLTTLQTTTVIPIDEGVPASPAYWPYIIAAIVLVVILAAIATIIVCVRRAKRKRESRVQAANSGFPKLSDYGGGGRNDDADDKSPGPVASRYTVPSSSAQYSPREQQPSGPKRTTYDEDGGGFDGLDVVGAADDTPAPEDRPARRLDAV